MTTRYRVECKTGSGLESRLIINCISMLTVLPPRCIEGQSPAKDQTSMKLTLDIQTHRRDQLVSEGLVLSDYLCIKIHILITD